MPIENSPPQLPEVRPGKYSDGHPLDEVHYLECKIILKPDGFTSGQSFFEYGKLVRRAAEKCEIDLCDRDVVLKPAVREVLFMDTPDFRLYNNAFILRRRISFDNGFATGDPEIVFKFRHPDLQKAADLDVRPNFAGEYRIKFKAEALPLKDQLGGYRLLYSHNAQFGLSQEPEGDRMSIALLARIFPCLGALRKSDIEKLEFVNQTFVEELCQDLGTLTFGKGLTGNCNISLWRERGMHKPLCGEFAYQCKFKRRDDAHEKAKDRCKKFFIELQQIGHEWVSLGTTKTGIVYRLKGNPPQTHE